MIAPPLIGLTTYGRDENGKFTLPGEYVDAVRRAGGLALLIPPGEEQLDALLSLLDGLILVGGGDMDPRLYNGTPHETVYMVDEERDTTELTITHKVLDMEMPLFGICRGLQILNVALGGTLHEHLPDAVGEDVLHRVPPRHPTLHTVQVEPASKLAEIMQTAEPTPASWHHQAIKEVAAGLAVVAHAPDGTIEAVEMQANIAPQKSRTHIVRESFGRGSATFLGKYKATNERWLVAVQWHPEITAADDPTQQRLFDDFVAAARRHKCDVSPSSGKGSKKR